MGVKTGLNRFLRPRKKKVLRNDLKAGAALRGPFFNQLDKLFFKASFPFFWKNSGTNSSYAGT